ncbi:MAG: UDP-N-acetylmuramoyl-tripeptide--D-alanyl-D-alanine ligase [Sphaerochaetaceae bacterium]
MSICTVSECAVMSQGMLIARNGHVRISSVVIDSRLACSGALFVALPGEKADGHDYVKDVLAKGAVAAMVSTEQSMRMRALVSGSGLALIVVDNPLRGLQKFAAAHVARFPHVKKVGITGSCGKTTTKEMVASILACMGNTVKTPGNYNSEIGLALSVFQIDKDTGFGVFEMGVDHVGEMDHMLGIWKPDAGILTNIGISHLGKMGSMQSIAHEKSKLFHPGISSGFISENCAWGPYISQLRDIKLLPYGLNSTDGIQSLRPVELQGWQIGYQDQTINLHSVGKHNLMDALAAISLARSFGASGELIKEGLENFQPTAGRSRILDGDVTIIEDCYNASVDSTDGILDYLGSLSWKGEKKVILGSMKELGPVSEAAHRSIGQKLLRLQPSSAYFYGKEMESAWKVMKQGGYNRHLFFTEDFEELEKHVVHETHRGDLVLLKGSRAMAMERLVPTIKSIA